MSSLKKPLRHWLIVVLVFLIGVCFMSSAYAASDKHGGTLVIAISSDPATLNPHITTGANDSPVTSNIFDAPMYLDLNSNLVPGLAESWEVSEDGLTYTFHLKKATWHDGKPFTSADMVFTLNEIQWTHSKGAWWKQIKDTTKVEAPDDHTVVLKLAKPFAPLLNLMAYETGGTMMMPKHLYEGTDLKKNPYNWKPIGTGPFMFKAWVRGSHIELVRNPNYYDAGKEDLPYADRVVARIIPSGTGRVMALKRGEVDFIPNTMVPGDEVEELRKDPNIAIDDRKAMGSYKYILMNLRNPILANKDVRHALAYGIDKKKIVDLALAGQTIVAKTFIIPNQTWAYNPNVVQYPYNVEKANALLDKAGYKKGADGMRFKLRLTMSGRGADKMIIPIIRDELRKIGIEAQVVFNDLATFYDQVFARWDFDLAVQQMSSQTDPSAGCTRFLHSKNIKKGRARNVMGYSNPEVDELLNKEPFEPNLKKRAAMWFRIQEIVMEDLPFIPTHLIPSTNVFRANWAGLITKGNSSAHSREHAYMKKK